LEGWPYFITKYVIIRSGKINKKKSVDVINPPVIIDDVGVNRHPKSVRNILFSGICIIGGAPVVEIGCDISMHIVFDARKKVCKYARKQV
jgi:hypothetical protein